MNVRRFVACGLAALVVSLSGTARAATLEDIQGEVLANRGGGYKRVHGPVVLKAGDTIVVAKRGASAVLSYDDGCKVPVDFGSAAVAVAGVSAAVSACALLAGDRPESRLISGQYPNAISNDLAPEPRCAKRGGSHGPRDNDTDWRWMGSFRQSRPPELAAMDGHGLHCRRSHSHSYSRAIRTLSKPVLFTTRVSPFCVGLTPKRTTASFHHEKTPLGVPLR